MKFLTWLKSLFNQARKVKMEPILDNAASLQAHDDLSTENSSTLLPGADLPQISTDASTVTVNNLLPVDTVPQPESVSVTLGADHSYSQILPQTEDEISELDATLSRVKALLLVADHAVSEVWDDAVAFVKKAIKTEEEVADKLGTVLLVAGHDVSDVLKDAFDFAKKY